MRCLLCGKELALIKRWTGGEFCSVAHQRQYQEESSELALSRLLRAETGDANQPPQIKPAAVHVPVHHQTEELDPTFTGFIVDLPPAGSAERVPARASDPVPVWRAELSFPNRPSKIQKAQLSATAKVVAERSIPILDCVTCKNDLGVSMREFTPNSPVFELDLPMAQTGFEKSEEPVPISQLPHPAPDSPHLWQERERGFDAISTPLGVFAGVAFRTTGIQDNEDQDHPDGKLPAVTPPMPELVTEPMPLTLNGLAPAKGQPVQLASTGSYSIEVQVPRSSALPLRPLMTFGPARSPQEPVDGTTGEKKPWQAAPLASPPTLLDLVLPGLRQKSSESLWSRLRSAAKARRHGTAEDQKS